MDFVRPIEAIIPGAQGKLLAVLVETTAELNLRTLARLAGVSVAQASRIMPHLEAVGMVERRDVPPSALFRLVRGNIAAEAVAALARASETVLAEIGRTAAALPIPPVSVIAFGSLVRGEAGEDSDIDLAVVRPAGVSDDDNSWSMGIEAWRTSSRTLTGNTVDVLEIGRDEVAQRLAGRSQVWRDIRKEGAVVHGLNLEELSRPVDG